MIIPILTLTLLLSQMPDRTAQQQFETGNYKAAESTLKTTLARSSKKAPVLFWIGRCDYELRRYDEAIKEFEEAVKIDPKSSDYQLWLGRAYGAEAELDNSFFLARKLKLAYETAVRLNPGNIAARRDLMQFYVEAPWIVGGDRDKANKEVEAIAAIDQLQGRLARAIYLTSDKQWQKAATEYYGIMKTQPRDMEAYMQAADFFVARRDAGGIEMAVEGASRIDRNDPRLGFYRGVALGLRKADPALAEQLLKAYIREVPENSDYPSHKSASEWLRRIGK
jgi:tetratricopeptide (TPR) repeat protein